MCRCLARGGVGGVWGEWVRGLCLGFTKPVGTGGVWDVCPCSSGVGGVGGVDGWFGPGSCRKVWCYVGVRCESGFLWRW